MKTDYTTHDLVRKPFKLHAKIKYKLFCTFIFLIAKVLECIQSMKIETGVMTPTASSYQHLNLLNAAAPRSAHTDCFIFDASSSFMCMVVSKLYPNGSLWIKLFCEDDSGPYVDTNNNSANANTGAGTNSTNAEA